MNQTYIINVFDKRSNKNTLKFKLIENKGVFRLYTINSIFSKENKHFKPLKQLVKNYAITTIKKGVKNDIQTTDLLKIELKEIN